MDVSEKTVEQLAKLSRINLKDGEKEELVTDLKKILDFVGQLQEVDLEGTEPLTFITENTIQREDNAKADIEREDALRNAPQHNESYFMVPKVIK